MDIPPQDGVIIKDHAIGSVNTYKVRNLEAVWPTPGGEVQRSSLIDTQACVSYSAVHCIESQIKFLTGRDVNYSERFLAKMSGTTIQGNWQEKVLQAIQQYGLVLDQDWPEPTSPSFDWNTYYADPTPEQMLVLLAAGQEFLKEWTVTGKWVAPEEEHLALQEAPLQDIITQEHPMHSVMEFAQTQYFDTYQPYVKTLPSVYDRLEILIEQKNTMNQDALILNYNGKVGVFSPLATEVPEEVAAFNRIFNVSITVAPDGSVPEAKPVKDA